MLHGGVRKISRVHLEEYKDYLLEAPMLRRKGTISHNSAVTYFACMVGMLKKAYRLGKITTNVADMVEGISPYPTVPEHFTPDEVRRLIATPCAIPLLKKAALFSLHASLRWSDIVQVSPDTVIKTKDGWARRYRQKKTGAVEYVPLSEKSLEYLDDFRGLDYDRCQRPLKKWLADAGCKGTFHKFRHTFATTLISNGADVYVVSKLMGHRNVKTTQVYAEVVDARKIETLNLLNF